MPIPPRPVPAQQINPYGLRFFSIDGATPVDATNDKQGNPTQWIYDVTEQYKTGTGYGAWATKPNGFTGDLVGYNFLENGNTGVGRQQNGVDHDGVLYASTSTFKLQPLSGIHPGMIVLAPDGGGGIVEEVWLMPYSGEDGECA